LLGIGDDLVEKKGGDFKIQRTFFARQGY